MMKNCPIRQIPCIGENCAWYDGICEISSLSASIYDLVSAVARVAEAIERGKEGTPKHD